MELRRREADEPGRNTERSSPVWVAGFTLLLAGAALTVPAAGLEERTTSPTVRQQYDTPLSQYRAFRRMHAKSEKFSHEGWVDAWTELDGGQFRYEIVSERGSDYVRNKVLKSMLKREQELVAEGLDRAALTDENYEFEEQTPSASGLRYVLLKPKRKDVVLVDGRMVLSADGSALMRIEGRLAKNPSFWTSLVNVVRHFACVDGVRVPVSTESIAKVKFAGESRLTVSYEYETINGRPVTLATRQVLASAAPGR
jgi:hypothetical protein